MGNAILCAFPHQDAAAAASAAAEHVLKLVHSNGLVEEFYRSVMISELSPDYPNHFFCHSQSLLSAISAPSSPSSSSSLALALPDDFHMQLGQIYFLLPLHSRLSDPSIAALLSKASIASSRESYRDIHVVPLSEYSILDSLDESRCAFPISHDFVKQLLAETRLQLPSPISGPFLMSPLQQECSKAVSSSSANAGRLSGKNRMDEYPILNKFYYTAEELHEEYGLSLEVKVAKDLSGYDLPDDQWLTIFQHRY
ncbi:hypothetical protein L7F22_030261 [Adiantum nelumboides]|nr:hypothetical protein [Adiantum nelumboides]